MDKIYAGSSIVSSSVSERVAWSMFRSTPTIKETLRSSMLEPFLRCPTRAALQSPDYRPPATAPSAPPAYPATAYPPAASAPGQPQAPPPYPGATAPQQGGVYYSQHANKR